MLIVKITILLWVLFFIIRFFVNATISTASKMMIAAGYKPKMRLIDHLLVIIFLLAVIGTVAGLVWFLFFR